MSSIALSTKTRATKTRAATAQGWGSEADLARRAAHGDRGAFEEVFARHSEAGWRLAQAVAADRDGAVGSFRDGFVRAVKGRRAVRRAGAASLGDDILSAVYTAASAASYDRSATPATGLHRPSAPPGTSGADLALADAAFRSLPERWRAAVWLSEVEGFPTERVASVMGVSTAVAVQLRTRGGRGLAGRFVQSHREPPAQLGAVLRPLAIPAPPDLDELTAAGWASVGASRRAVAAPALAWLDANGVRPLAVAVGGLLAFGLIGMGVIPLGSTTSGALGATGTAPLSGAVPVGGCGAGTASACSASARGTNPVSAKFGPASGTAAVTGTHPGSPLVSNPSLPTSGSGSLPALGSGTPGSSTGSASTGSGSTGAASAGSPAGGSSGSGSSGSGSSDGSAPSGGSGSTGLGSDLANTVGNLAADPTGTATQLVGNAGSTVAGTLTDPAGTLTNPIGALSSVASTPTTTVPGGTTSANPLPSTNPLQSVVQPVTNLLNGL